MLHQHEYRILSFAIARFINIKFKESLALKFNLFAHHPINMNNSIIFIIYNIFPWQIISNAIYVYFFTKNPIYLYRENIQIHFHFFYFIKY